MIVSIHQPGYFPWLGLLDKIFKSDLFILMDEVQLADRLFQHRNVFLDINGKIKYLTVPINKRGYRNKTIKEITVADSKWQKTHNNFIKCNYRKSPFFDRIYPRIKFIFEKDYRFLIDVLVDSMLTSFDFFPIDTKLVFQSSLDYDRDKKKSDLILELVRVVGSNRYLSGTGAKEYLNLDDFDKANIDVVFNNFTHPVYRQVNSPTFIEGMSGLDFLFSVGNGDIFRGKHNESE